MKKINITPDSYLYSTRYGRRWANLNRCKECHTIGMREQYSRNYPCYICGGKIEEEYAVGIWRKPKYKFLFFWKIEDGYWEIKK